ncbi:MAG: PilZ domain-containing protein [Nitrospiraceae bacterium]|nr:MAG: PilZ domain-containing protein [Nitrospiraceae bacterium]
MISTNSGIRRFRRYDVDHMSMQAKALINTDVELSNISTTGACITTYERLQPGGRHLIELKAQKAPLLLRCKMIWRNPSVTVKDSYRTILPSFKAGLVFKDLSSDKLIQLKDYIRLSGIPDVKRASSKYKASALRFNVQSIENAVLYYPSKSTVKTISFGGMCIQTQHELIPEKRLTMTLLLPGEVLPSRFQGRVTSIIPAGNPGEQLYNTGIEFLNMKDRDKVRLGKLMHHI